MECTLIYLNYVCTIIALFTVCVCAHWGENILQFIFSPTQLIECNDLHNFPPTHYVLICFIFPKSKHNCRWFALGNIIIWWTCKYRLLPMSISSWQIHLPRSEFNWLPNGQRTHSHIGIPFLWPFVAVINISKASVASVTIHIHISDHGGKNGETGATHTRQTPLSILVSVRVCCQDRPEAPPPPSVMWFYLKLLGKAEVTHSVSNKIRRHAWAKLECDFRIALGLYLVVRSDLGPSSSAPRP